MRSPEPRVPPPLSACRRPRRSARRWAGALRGSGAARHPWESSALAARHPWESCPPSPLSLPAQERGDALPQGRGRAEPRGCSAAALCPVVRRRAGVPSRFLRCLHPISSGQVASLKPSSSRARKATNRSVGLGNCRRAVPPCAEKTQQRVSTCPGEGAEGHTGTPDALRACPAPRTSGGLRAYGDSNCVAIGLVRGFPALSGC